MTNEMSELELRYEQFVKELENKHKRMFSRPYGGLAIGAGWWPIVESLCFAIDRHMTHLKRRRVNAILEKRAKRDGIGALVAFHQGRESVIRDWHVELARKSMETDKPIPERVQPVVVEQIKEKFGGLRFYHQGGDEYVDGLVTMAEEWASRTCEVCGSPGRARQGGWIRTLCDTHAKKD